MNDRNLIVGAFVALLISAPAAIAADVGGIAIHGAVSATAATSNKYNYYGETDGELDVIQKEITVNGAYRFENGLRAAAQLYAYELTGYSSIGLDFATLDYAFNSKLGVRVGRNKMSVGFYNEVQDLDQIRIFASLPLAFYPRGTRSIAANYDGAGLYGTQELGSNAGSFEYQVFGGKMSNIKKDEPFAKGLANSQGLDLDNVFGAVLIWNTAVDGLRFGYSYQFLPELIAYSSLPLPGFTAQVKTFVDVHTHVSSVEYTTGKWTAAAEYKYSRNPASANIAALGVTNQKTESETLNWYGQLTYQATKEFGIGAYYAYSDDDFADTDPLDEKFTTMKDTAVAVSYGVTSYWVLKAEYHFINGLGGLDIVGDINPGAKDANWNYIVLKTTFSF